VHISISYTGIFGKIPQIFKRTSNNRNKEYKENPPQNGLNTDIHEKSNPAKTEGEIHFDRLKQIMYIMQIIHFMQTERSAGIKPTERIRQTGKIQRIGKIGSLKDLEHPENFDKSAQDADF